MSAEEPEKKEVEPAGPPSEAAQLAADRAAAKALFLQKKKEKEKEAAPTVDQTLEMTRELIAEVEKSGQLSEKAVITFLRNGAIKKLTKKQAYAFAADLVDSGVLQFELGIYRKAPAQPVAPEPAPAPAPVEVASVAPEVQEPVVPDAAALEVLGQSVARVQQLRSAMIAMMNQVEGARRVATADEKRDFYKNLAEYLQIVNDVEKNGLPLSPAGKEKKKVLGTIHALTEKRIDDEDSFRRALIGIGNELTGSVKAETRRLERAAAEQAQAELPQAEEVVPEPPVTAEKAGVEVLRGYGKELERARKAMMERITTIEHPTEEQRHELYAELDTFLQATNKLLGEGLKLSSGGMRERVLLENIAQERRISKRRIYNLTRFQYALERIDEEFFAQVEPEANKTEPTIAPVAPEPIIEPAASTEPVIEEPAAVPTPPTPEPIAPAVEPPRVSNFEIIPENERLERVTKLRARAAMVNDMLGQLPGTNPQLEKQVSRLLVMSLVSEILDVYDANGFVDADELQSLLPKIRTAINEGTDLIDADFRNGPRTWKQLAATLSGGMNKIEGRMDKEWRAENPGDFKNPFFGHAEIIMSEFALAPDDWIAKLDSPVLNDDERQLLLKMLTQFKREAVESYDDWIAAKAERLSVPEPTPPPPTAPNTIPLTEPLELKLKNGEFTVSMAEALANDSFYSFFTEFDTARNTAEEFDPAKAEHRGRFEQGLEAYSLWRSATAQIQKFITAKMESDFGLPPASDFASFERELRGRVLENPRAVSKMLNSIDEYQEQEQQIIATEQKIEELGGVMVLTAKVKELEDAQNRLGLERDLITREYTVLNEWRRGLTEAQVKTTWRDRLGRAGDLLRGVRKARNAAEKAGFADAKAVAVSEREFDNKRGEVQSRHAGVVAELARVKADLLQTRSALRQAEQLRQFGRMRNEVFMSSAAFRDMAQKTAEEARERIFGALAEPDKKIAISKADNLFNRMLGFLGNRGDYLTVEGLSSADDRQTLEEIDTEITAEVGRIITAAMADFKPKLGAEARQLREAVAACGPRAFIVAREVVAALKKTDPRKALILQSIFFDLEHRS